MRLEDPPIATFSVARVVMQVFVGVALGSGFVGLWMLLEAHPFSGLAETKAGVHAGVLVVGVAGIAVAASGWQVFQCTFRGALDRWMLSDPDVAPTLSWHIVPRGFESRDSGGDALRAEAVRRRKAVQRDDRVRRTGLPLGVGVPRWPHYVAVWVGAVGFWSLGLAVLDLVLVLAIFDVGDDLVRGYEVMLGNGSSVFGRVALMATLVSAVISVAAHVVGERIAHRWSSSACERLTRLQVNAVLGNRRASSRGTLLLGVFAGIAAVAWISPSMPGLAIWTGLDIAVPEIQPSAGFGALWQLGVAAGCVVAGLCWGIMDIATGARERRRIRAVCAPGVDVYSYPKTPDSPRDLRPEAGADLAAASLVSPNRDDR